MVAAAHCRVGGPQSGNTLQHTAARCNTLTATHCNTLTRTHCTNIDAVGTQVSVQHTAKHCITLQHIVTHCNTPTATHCKTDLTNIDAVGKEVFSTVASDRGCRGKLSCRTFSKRPCATGSDMLLMLLSLLCKK